MKPLEGDPVNCTRLELYYASNRFMQEEQYYTYGVGNLVADIGGYLGLLLGHSIINFYDWGKALWSKLK